MQLATRPENNAALQLAADRHWRIFPVQPATKIPAIKSWRIKATDDPVVWDQWWGPDGLFSPSLVGVLTGPESGIWVFDVDPKNGGMEEYTRLDAEHDGDWGPCLRVDTPSGGIHLIYQYPPEAEFQTRGVAKVKSRTGVLPGCDVRGQGGQIVAPLTQDGRSVSDPEAVIGQAPTWLLDVVLADAAASTDGSGGTGAGTSQFTDLADNPPLGEGDRNNWLAAMAGHYAAETDFKDRYEAKVRQANRSMGVPLDEAEVSKLAKSIWQTETAKSRRKVVPLREAPTDATGASPSASGGRGGISVGIDDEELAEAASALGTDSGGLVGARAGGKRTGTLIMEINSKQGDKTVRIPHAWADFDMEALGVTSDDSGERFYLVNLIRGRDKVERELILPAKVLADRKQLVSWLAQQRVTIAEPTSPVLRLGTSERLLRYLEAQAPAEFTVVDHLGWSKHASAFLTTTGQITREGEQPFGQFRPSKAILENKEVLFRYGFGHTEAEVRDVLNEILTFHYQDEAAVFGAWWAATLLKHVAMQHSALFPLMAIEAPSESGKTTGMFGMLVRLSGWAGEQSTYTKASFRDALTVNRNGIIWLDDPDSVSNLEEVLRAATAEGAMTKKSDDLAHNQNARLISPVVITGEALGFKDQKALRDRAVHLAVQSPTSRTSQRPDRKGQSQWDDILDFKDRYPDLTEYAGTLVQMALSHSAEFARDVRSLRGGSGRRIGDTVAILRAGARLLDRLTDDGGFDDQVGHWLDENGVEDTGAQNSLTLTVVPALLRYCGHRANPTRDNQYKLPTPVLVREGPADEVEIWVNTALAAEWWRRIQNGRVTERTETASAFNDQMKALGVTGRGKQIRVPSEEYRAGNRGADDDSPTAEKPWYRMLPPEVTTDVLTR